MTQTNAKKLLAVIQARPNEALKEFKQVLKELHADEPNLISTPETIDILKKIIAMDSDALSFLHCLFSNPQIHQIFQSFSDEEIKNLWSWIMQHPNKEIDVQIAIIFKILICSIQKNPNFTVEEAQALFPNLEKFKLPPTPRPLFLPAPSLRPLNEFFEYSQKIATYPDDFFFCFGFDATVMWFQKEAMPISEGESQNDHFVRCATTTFQDPDPLHRALSNGYTTYQQSFFELLLSRDEIDMNRKGIYIGDTYIGGKDTNRVGSVKQTVLHIAIKQGNSALVKLLLEQKRIDPIAINSDGSTPLLLAIEVNDGNIVRLLLTHPTILETIHTVDHSGHTPLCRGLLYRAPQACEALLKNEHFIKTTSDENKEKLLECLLECRVERVKNVQIIPLLFEKMNISPQEFNAENSAKLLADAKNADNIVVFKLMMDRLRTLQALQNYPDPEVDPNAFAKLVPDSPQITAFYAARSVLKDNRHFSCDKVFQNLQAFPTHQTWTDKHKQLAFYYAQQILGIISHEAFALAVFLSDGYLRLKNLNANTTQDSELNLTEALRAQRFFRITSQLSLELQMLLCHRVEGASRKNIPSKEFEPVFQDYALRWK